VGEIPQQLEWKNLDSKKQKEEGLQTVCHLLLAEAMTQLTAAFTHEGK
jgi:hypothetical protein